MTHLLDANVLIALVVREHEHHERATAWLAVAGDVAVCPIVEGALLRFLIRMGESPRTAGEVIRSVRSAERCSWWTDDLSYDEVDLASVRGHREVTDSYLAALAERHGGHVATLVAALADRHPDQCLLVPLQD